MSQRVWVLTQEDEEQDRYVWVHATEDGARQHMGELQNDCNQRIEDGVRISYSEFWRAWVAHTPGLEDEVCTWSIEEQQVFQ